MITTALLVGVLIGAIKSIPLWLRALMECNAREILIMLIGAAILTAMLVAEWLFLPLLLVTAVGFFSLARRRQP